MNEQADTKEFVLRTPLKFNDGSEVKAVSLREPVAFELERAESEAMKVWRIENPDKKEAQVTGSNIIMQLIAQVSTPRLTLAAVRQLKSRDFSAMRDYVSGFLSDSGNAETGEA